MSLMSLNYCWVGTHYCLSLSDDEEAEMSTADVQSVSLDDVAFLWLSNYLLFRNRSSRTVSSIRTVKTVIITSLEALNCYSWTELVAWLQQLITRQTRTVVCVVPLVVKTFALLICYKSLEKTASGSCLSSTFIPSPVGGLTYLP